MALMMDAGKIVPNPQDILTDELRGILRKNRAEVIEEINQWNGSFLWVATDFSAHEDIDPRLGREWDGGDGRVYRMLDAPYFAWLRSRMDLVEKSPENNARYGEAAERFQKVQAWAMENLGESALDNGIRTTNVNLYAPPSVATLEEYKAGWERARRENLGRWMARGDSRLPALRGRMAGCGYAVLRWPMFDGNVIVARDSRVRVDSKFSGAPRFDLGELARLRGASVEEVVGVCEVKSVFDRARVVG